MNKAILWDFDGTLSYPNTAFSNALYRAVIQCGLHISQEAASAFLQTAYSWKTPEQSYPQQTGDAWWEAIFVKISQFCVENGIDPKDSRRICQHFRELLIDVNNYRLYDDTIETLKKCSALGYQNFLATNNYPKILDNIQKLGIAPYLSGSIVSSHIGYEKPRAEFYRYAKTLAGNPDIMYMVGDNPQVDIIGGNHAGCITIAVHSCIPSTAAYYCAQLSQIPAILK